MIKVLETSEQLSKEAAGIFIASAKEAIANTGKFLVSLSGGSTPKRVFEILAEESYRKRVEWNKIHFFWGDERCVPFDHSDSNAGMTFKALLNHVDVVKEQVHIINGALAPRDAASEYNELLLSFFPNKEKETFDLVFLGMGADGHTASLFPFTPVLEERSHFVKEVYLEEIEKFRITITQDVFNMAKRVVFLVTGSNKAEVLNEVMFGEYNYKKYPSQLIKPVTGELVWLLDNAAAEVIKTKI